MRKRTSARLTDRDIRTASAGADYLLNDGRGLNVRVYPSGRKSFIYRYKVKGRERKLELGDYPRLSLAQARKLADDLKEKRRNGIDPIEQREVARRAIQEKEAADFAATTVGGIAKEWYARVIAKRFKRPEQVEQMLNRDILPAIGNLTLKEATRGHISQALNAIVDRGSPATANRTLAVIKQICLYAVKQGHIEASPAALLVRKDVGGTEKERKRALTFAEIGKLIALIEDTKAHGLSWQVKSALTLLLLTGQRLGETVSTEWSDIDGDEWHIPASRTKNGNDHVVFLSREALAVLAYCKQRGEDSPYLLPNEERLTQPITTRAVSRAVNRLFDEKRIAIAKFTPHDLRRTFVTRLSDLNIAPHVIEKIVNHQLGGVLQVYQRGEFLPERKIAMEAWGKRIGELRNADESKVVFLGKKKAIAK